MSDRMHLKGEKVHAKDSIETAGRAENASTPCSMPGQGWLKGPLGMVICCVAPLLLFAAISFFGLSLGSIASWAVSLVALAACPVGMFVMMRMMMKDKKGDQTIVSSRRK